MWHVWVAASLLLAESIIPSSARIGRLEDEEDIKRERMELARKKQRREGGLPQQELVQSKLQFT